MRTVVSSRMFKALRRIFETVPLPHLPDPCFKTETESPNRKGFYNIYRIVKSNVIDDKNTLNFTNIANYTHITCCPCPVENLWPYRQNFHNVLKLKKKNVDTAKYILENALKTRKLDKSGLVLVGTHVRRSDYLHYAGTKHLRYPSVEFYINAFNFFRLKCKNVIFIVVSDDLKWCEDNLSAPDVIFAGNGNRRKPEIDFTLLTVCDHHIRGLGTFGYTSAFLGTGSAVVNKLKSQKAEDIKRQRDIETLPAQYTWFEIFRRRKLKEKSILTLEELSKSNFTCDSTSQFYFVDE
ncbi:Galactoside 2-alpha-L-fucosyltransferase 1 [Armadillidium vulgare]|nr:Galactoside 2-alpha-L-fucosyltransferase 1 [Armadillidium vulgare]